MNPVKSRRTILVDDVEYVISSIPLSYAPLNKKVHDLLTRIPESGEAAEAAQKELAELVDAILKVTVNRSVPPEHTNLVYTAVADLTNDVVKQAEFFRDQSEPSSEKGS